MINRSLQERRKKKGNGNRFVLSKSFDNGEVLSQKNVRPQSVEYLVQSSITDIPFEEYTVPVVPTAATADTDNRQIQPVAGQNPIKVAAPKESPPPGDAQKPPVSDRLQKHQLLAEPAPAAAVSKNSPHAVASGPAKEASFEYLAAASHDDKRQVTDEDDFVRDMQAILGGEKQFNEKTKTVEKKEDKQSQQPEPKPAPTTLSQLENKHAIFDQIAESMSYAKAYDLGSIDLDKRFNDFDKFDEVKKNYWNEKKEAPLVTPLSNAVQRNELRSEEFIRDLNYIAKSRTYPETFSTSQSAQPYLVNQARDNHEKYLYESPSMVMSKSIPDFSYAQNPGIVIGGIAVADAIQIGLGATAIVQAQVSASQGSFTLSYDKAQRLLTPEARMLMPGAQTTKHVYSKELFWIGELKKGFADASIIIEWEGNAYGEIGTAVIRRDIQNSTDWTSSSANTTITKIDRIPLPNTDPRAWPLVYSYEGTFNPAGNGKYEYSGEFEINAFGGLRFTRHEVVNRSLIEFAKLGKPEEYVRKGTDTIVSVPPIPQEQIDYLRSKLP